MIARQAIAGRQSKASRMWRLTQLSLAQFRLRYVVEGLSLDEKTEAALKADSRVGSKAILDAVRRRRFENHSEGQRLRKLLRYENALWSTGRSRSTRDRWSSS